MADKKIKIFKPRYYNLLKLLDFIIINLTCLLYVTLLTPKEYISALLVGFSFSLIFISCGVFFNIYASQFRYSYLSKAFYLFLCLAISWILTVSLYSASVMLFYAQQQFDVAVLIKGLSHVVLLIFVLLLALRIVVSRLLFAQSTQVAILGITLSGLAIEQALRKEYQRGHLDIKFYDDRNNIRDSHFMNTKCSGSAGDLLDQAKSREVDAVYIALPMIAQERIRKFLHDFSDSTIDIFLVPDLFSYSSHITQLRMFDNIQTISIFTSPFEDEGAIIKRIEDIILGTLFTLASLPLMLFAAVGIKLTSPGPILFKQSRYGLNGKEIKIWKFRSMSVMENSTVVTQASRNDPRVTRFGAFLRRTSLDELPQFFNVLQGTMSIVGPRPHAVAHNEEYRKLVENYMIRHKVKPGITGLAQINGFRGETDTLDKMEMRVLYDLNYIKSWSLWLDIKIVFLTFFRGFVGKNAF